MPRSGKGTGYRQLSDDVRAGFSQLLSSVDPNWGSLLGSVLPEATFAECERCIGIGKASSEFRQDIIAAIFITVPFHLCPLKRYSDIRKELIQIERLATTAADALAELSGLLAELIFMKNFAAIVNELYPREPLSILADFARDAAPKLPPDRGGRPRAFAFDRFTEADSGRVQSRHRTARGDYL
jgi:hypothetical protein